MAWSGWVWDTRRQRWDRVCEAEALAECSRRLGEVARVRKVQDAHTALTGGAAPDFRPRGRG